MHYCRIKVQYIHMILKDSVLGRSAKEVALPTSLRDKKPRSGVL